MPFLDRWSWAVEESKLSKPREQANGEQAIPLWYLLQIDPLLVGLEDMRTLRYPALLKKSSSQKFNCESSIVLANFLCVDNSMGR